MRRSLLAVAPAVIAIAIVIAGCGSGSNNNSNSTAPQMGAATQAAAPASGTTVAVKQTKLGQILVDAKGRSLYLFEQDKGMSSTCYGACASLWPPLTVSGGTPKAGSGIAAAKLGTTQRKDGKAEVTYNGHPLYYYAGDQKPGDTAGEGLNDFGATWDVVSNSGKGIDAD
jgi:predicted lipoprotein with Yx(FWY)xxD motif